MRMIYGLSGKIYYIDEQAEECYYLKQLMQIRPEVMECLLSAYELEREAGRELRNYVEIILPLLASELKMGKNWNYQMLYLTMLEATAKFFRVPKYRIYTEKELLRAVCQKAAGRELTEDVPGFVHVILNR